MRKLKLMTIAGTRPEIIRLSEIIKMADRLFDHRFVHTGQNYDPNLRDVFYKDLGLREPDLNLDIVGASLGESMGNIIAKSYEVLRQEMPDALLILGDTNSALSAISAKRLKIPIFHMEAGNRCFDENLPEETNRRIVDHIADVNLPYTEQARRNLIAEGLKREYIFVTGSPMAEVIQAQTKRIKNSNVLEMMGLNPFAYFVLSAHREENIDKDESFHQLMDAIDALAEQYTLPVVYSVHPRTMKKISDVKRTFHPLVRLCPPFSFSDYSFLLQHAKCVISDSGTIPEESSISKFPAVSIRTSTERQEAVEEGGVIIAGVTKNSILQSIEMAVQTHSLGLNGGNVLNYSDTNVSEKVLKIIQSYTHIINRNVWNKAEN